MEMKLADGMICHVTPPTIGHKHTFARRQVRHLHLARTKLFVALLHQYPNFGMGLPGAVYSENRSPWKALYTQGSQIGVLALIINLKLLGLEKLPTGYLGIVTFDPPLVTILFALIVKVDYVLGNWTSTPCSALCGNGTTTSTREVVKTGDNGGKPCKAKQSKESHCNRGECFGKYYF